MNDVIADIVLGFGSEMPVPTISCVQFDNNVRKIRAELIDGLSDYVVQDTTYIYVKEKYESGTIVPPIKIDKNNLSDDNTVLYIPITTHMLLESGVHQCDIVFIQSHGEPFFNNNGVVIGTDNEILTTQRFNLFVKYNVYQGGNPSNSSLDPADILANMVYEAQFIIDNLDPVETNEDQRITNENKRVANETVRVSNETTRISNENARIDAEDARSSAETTRISNEAERVEHEETREERLSAAENSLVSAHESIDKLNSIFSDEVKIVLTDPGEGTPIFCSKIVVIDEDWENFPKVLKVYGNNEGLTSLVYDNNEENDG